MGVTLTDVLLFGKAQSDDVDNATLVIYRRNILRWSTIGGYLNIIVKGVAPLSLPDAIANSLQYVKAFGGTEQNGTPTPDAPIDIVSNNGVLKVSPNLFDKNASYALFNGYLTNASVGQNTTLSAYSGGDKTIIIKVAPNTTYTVTRATNLGAVYNRIRCAAFTTLPSGGSTGVILYNLSNNTQQANATFTTLSDTQYVAINVRNSGAVGDDWTQFVDAFQLEKGSTATPYMPYGQIYTDGTVETINVYGKNLFDENDVILGYFYNDSGTYTSNNVTYTSGKIPMNAGTTVTFSRGLDVAGVYLRIHAFDSNDNWIGLVAKSPISTDLRCTGTTPANTSYIRVCGAKKAAPSTEIDHECQVELGSTATDYVPYFNGGTATAEMLLSLDTYTDEQEILSGAVTRNVGVKMFDGTESWARGTNNDASGHKVFYTDFSDKRTGSNRPMLCSHYAYVGSASYTTLTDGKFLSNASNTSVYFDGGANTTIAEWKQWLVDQAAAGTPVIVVYPLATSTTETVTGQTLQVTDGDNVLEITQASLTGLELEVEYQAAVSLTIQEVQDANLDPNVEVTIN